MAFGPFGGAESGDEGVYALGPVTSIVTTPVLAGTYCWQIDAKNADPNISQYGPTAGLSKPNFLIVGFLFRFAAEFDKAISIAELGQRSAGEIAVRFLRLGTDERFAIADKDSSTIGQTAASYAAINTTYPMLWYYDQRSTTNTRDILWVYKSGAWDKAIDVSDYGDANQTAIDAITFGTRVSKAAPTTGGPFFVDEMFVQTLDESPNTTPIGSVTTRYKKASANGTDLDFNTGTGTNPDFNDVDDIVSDSATTYDEGDVAGDNQSYAITDATAGDKPLAIQVIGKARRTGTSITVRSYIYDGTTREYNTQWSISISWVILNDSWVQKTYNQVNGATITESLFNTLEAGLEVVSIGGAGSTVQLSQIGLDYIIEGPYALPSGFPLAPRKVVQVKQAVNRANTY